MNHEHPNRPRRNVINTSVIENSIIYDGCNSFNVYCLTDNFDRIFIKKSFRIKQRNATTDKRQSTKCIYLLQIICAFSTKSEIVSFGLSFVWQLLSDNVNVALSSTTVNSITISICFLQNRLSTTTRMSVAFKLWIFVIFVFLCQAIGHGNGLRVVYKNKDAAPNSQVMDPETGQANPITGNIIDAPLICPDGHVLQGRRCRKVFHPFAQYFVLCKLMPPSNAYVLSVVDVLDVYLCCAHKL